MFCFLVLVDMTCIRQHETPAVSHQTRCSWVDQGASITLSVPGLQALMWLARWSFWGGSVDLR